MKSLTKRSQSLISMKSGRSQFITLALCIPMIISGLSLPFGKGWGGACFAQCTVVANAGKDTTICKGNSVTLTATGGNKYVWNTGKTTDTTASITVAPTFSTSYTVNVSDGKCSAIDTVKVNVVTAVVTGSTALCKNGNTVLTAYCLLPSATYLWSTGDITPTITAKPSNIPDTTVYWVAVSNGSCTDTAFSTVKVTKVIAVVSAKDSVLCKGSSTTLTANGGTKYVWNTGNKADTTATITVNPLADTKYSVKVFNCVCPDSTQMSIKVNSLPTVNAEKDTTLTLGSSITLSASGAGVINYIWSPSTGLSNTTIFNPTAKPTVTTVYVVTGTDANGCSNKDSVTITVRELECKEFFIPNAFSPNGNNFNDVLYVRGCPIDRKEVKEATFSIYDRWGKKVFETDDITKGWDGTYKGKALNTAVFVYYMKATLITDEVIEQRGNISLIR